MYCICWFCARALPALKISSCTRFKTDSFLPSSVSNSVYEYGGPTLNHRPAFVMSQGHDSIVARGIVEPDPSKDVELTIDGKKVKVPQGKAKPVSEYQSSRFMNSEYLVNV